MNSVKTKESTAQDIDLISSIKHDDEYPNIFEDNEEKVSLKEKPQIDNLDKTLNYHLNKSKSKKKRLLTINDFDEYTFNIHHLDLKSEAIVSRKFAYIINEASSDLGLSNLGSIEFWITFLILIINLWIRAYIHTFGSWVFLTMTGTSISIFDAMLYF